MPKIEHIQHSETVERGGPIQQLAPGGKRCRVGGGEARGWGTSGASWGPNGLLGVHQVEELLARLGVIPEHSQHGGGDRLAVDLLHTSHHHAHVPVETREGCVRRG